MSGSVNKVILVGNIGKNPEVRNSQDGQKMLFLSLATNESWKDKDTGAKKERTEWHKVVVFNSKLADFASQYLRKGSKVYIEGQLQTRKWVDNSGSENFSTEIILPRYGGELVMLNNTTAHVGGEDFGRISSSPNDPNYSSDEFNF